MLFYVDIAVGFLILATIETGFALGLFLKTRWYITGMVLLTVPIAMSLNNLPMIILAGSCCAYLIGAFTQWKYWYDWRRRPFGM